MMPILADYQQFDGLHWETGTVRNALAHRACLAPHTGQPITEALLMGIAGGAVFGYFTFDYKNHDPILALLTRNTFDPMPTLLERLGIVQNVYQTADANKAEQNLIHALEEGDVPIVWADMPSLPYNGQSLTNEWWEVMPIVVYGLKDGHAFIADRSRQPLQVSRDQLQMARGRIKKEKYRLVTLSAPNWDKLPSAVQKGIWQTIALYTEAPPKGARKNFGFAAYEHWAEMLVNTRNKQSWARYFPAGSRLYAALKHVYRWVMLWGAGDGFEREVYADFLDEAALILNKPQLHETGEHFRQSAKLWQELAQVVLPDSAPVLAETRHLLQKQHDLFIEQGGTSLGERLHLEQRLATLKREIAEEFPLNQVAIDQLLAEMHECVVQIWGVERQAIEGLQSALN